MPLTDLHNATLPHALRYTSCFGLNSSQGTYFHHIVQKSPAGTYLADLKHVSQPSSTSLLGRLLREACGTPPQLILQEPLRDNTHSRRAWYNFEVKCGPLQVDKHPVPSAQRAVDEAFPPTSNDPLSDEDPASMIAMTPIREPPSPPPATQSSVATSLAQPLSISVSEAPLESADTCQYPHPYGITNTQSSFTSPNIDGSNSPPQYLHYYSNETPIHSEPIQQDDMDCLPPSPFLSSDVDMDILTDFAPASPSYDHTPWNTIPEYTPVSPLHHTMFVATQPVPTWHTHIQEPPSSANQHNFGFAAPSLRAARNNFFGNTSVSVAPESPMDFSNPNFVPTYHSCPLDPINAMSDDHDTVEMHWREPPPQRAGTSHPTSVATLLDEFERSLTLVADETPSADNWSNYNDQPEPTPACLVEDELRTALEPVTTHPLQTNVLDAPLAILDHTDSPPFEREAAEPLGEDNDRTLARFLSLHDPPSRPLEQQSMEPLEEGHGQPHGDPRPHSEREATEPLEEGEDQSPACFQDLADQPRRLDRASLSTDTLPEVPVIPSPRALHPPSRPRPPTPPPSRRPTKPGPSHDSGTNQRRTRQSAARLAALDAKHPAKNTNTNQDLAQAGVQAGKRAGVRHLSMRCGTNRRKKESEEEEADREEIRPNRRDRTKRTRFVVPDAEEDPAARLLGRPRRTRGADKATDATTSAGARRTSVTGPPRSILRNARATAMPYQKAVRHAGRRASVP